MTHESVPAVVIVDAVRTPVGRHGGVLSGVRPDDLAAVPIRALIERTPEFPAEGPTLPASLRKALSRGLSRVPQDRYPDMGALLAALERVLSQEAQRPAAVAAEAPSPERAYPRCEHYLAGLPAGADSHPLCTMRALVVRLALARRPLDGSAPAPVRA